MEETAVPESNMAPVYPLGVNVIIARLTGVDNGPTNNSAGGASPTRTASSVNR
jgi:hypothetical protein